MPPRTKEEIIEKIMLLVEEWESSDKSGLIFDMMQLLTEEQLSTILQAQSARK